METLEIVKTAVEALRDKKAEDVTVIDITGVSSIADYFIIANGNNQNQLTAMQDAVDEALYKAGLHAKQIEGNNKSTWILMDYEDIIVHLFPKKTVCSMISNASGEMERSLRCNSNRYFV